MTRRLAKLPALCDVNVLFALVFEYHEFNSAVITWFDSLEDGEAGVCRVSQLGLLRLLCTSAATEGRPLTPEKSLGIWRTLRLDERIRFLQEPEGLDGSLNRLIEGRGGGRNLWTDAYLASFAMAAGLDFVTLDRGFQKFNGLRALVLNPA